jgi:hypothetical protein
LNNKQSGNLQSKNSTHFRLDDVCITEITAITKIMAGRMLLNLGSNAQKNLHMITQQMSGMSKPTTNRSISTTNILPINVS